MSQFSFVHHLQPTVPQKALPWSALLWEVGVLPHPGSHFLFLAPFPLAEFGSLPHPHSLRMIQCSTLPLVSVVDYIQCLCCSVLFRIGWNLSTSCLDWVPQRVCCKQHSPVGLVDLHRQLWNWASGETWWQLFPRQTLTKSQAGRK
jgi:hypothetical protein